MPTKYELEKENEELKIELLEYKRSEAETHDWIKVAPYEYDVFRQNENKCDVLYNENQKLRENLLENGKLLKLALEAFVNLSNNNK